MTSVLEDVVAEAEQQVLEGRPTGTPSPSISRIPLDEVLGVAAPETVDRLCYLAVLLARLHQRGEAVGLLQTSGASLGRSGAVPALLKVPALNRLAVTLTSLGAWNAARELLLDAARACPESRPLLCARTYADLAAVEVRAAHFDAAWEAARRARTFLAGQSPEVARDVLSLLGGVDLALARAGAGVSSVQDAADAMRSVVLPDGDSVASLAALTGRAVLAFEEARQGTDHRRMREVIDVLHIVACRAAASLGAEHPQTVVARVNLACAEFEWARRTGDTHRMLSCVAGLRATADAASSVLGAEHPVAVSALTNHATASLESARAEQSEEQLEEALRQLDVAAQHSQAVLGSQHPLSVLTAGTARAGHRLRTAGSDPTEPDGRGTTVTLIRTVVSDPWHPDEELVSPQSAALDLATAGILGERHRIASRIGNAGNASAALDLFARLESECRTRLGDNAPLTLRARHNVAYWTGVCGRAPHAKQLSLRLLRVYHDLFGNEHRAMRLLRDDLARWSGESGDPGEAVRRYADLRRDTDLLLGADHPETLLARHNTLYWTAVQGARAHVLSRFAGLLADQTRINGPDHPHTLAVRHNIAYWTEAKGDPREALRLFTPLLHDRTTALGREHPHTLLNAFHVARLTRHHEDASAGTAELTGLLPVFTRVFGDDHPWTRRLRREIEAS
ncbi:tetratricopeptide repeat protein [Streptomyces fulvoviolaceus]|uniref:tetratricopeptide repeat protein n=1 Tax=Streptomyces fulvoviolaceus TaxID=285535 RepID=UPI0021BE04C2|nr:tetratricopeptide repeat protein [Streptomyces fulvoviolaceus]MCT9080147.1 hypothetical protein [Streptomyces fulvoviolaceus]